MLLLFLAAIVYSIDKAIVGVLAEPIKADLAITDVQMSLLLGLAYTLFSAVLGVWLGNLVDRHVRRTLIFYAITLWSLATVAGGFAPDFGWFFVCRSLVGLGEAAISPAAFSLIADMFGQRQRGRAISVYLVGATVGTALSSVVPGWIVGSQLHIDVPGYGTLVPWRSAFLLCGIVGPLIGALFLTVREPARHEMVSEQNEARAAGQSGPSAKDKLALLWGRRHVLGPFFLGVGLFYVSFIGITAWTAPFISRTFSLTLPQFANTMGLILLIGGLLGYLMGGAVADSRMGGGPRGKLAIMSVLPFFALPGALAGYAPNVTLALTAVAFIALATPMLNVALQATVQDLVPNEMRGFSVGLLSLLIALPAGAGGPLAIAYVSEHILGDPARIGVSFLIVGVPSLLASACCFFVARRSFLAAPASYGFSK